jgi:hypothetical protein
VEAVRDQSVGGQRVLILRSTEFPRGARTQVGQLLEEIAAVGGQRLVVQNSEWRALLAMEVFRAEHGRKPQFTEWLRRERPLTRLHVIQSILHPARQADASIKLVRHKAPEPAAGSESAWEGAGILLGHTKGNEPVVLDPMHLTGHAAILGEPGSGHTMLALHIVEHLLDEGYSAVLMDRKGELCGYAADFPLPENGAATNLSLLNRLREKVDVAVYTPGRPDGRPLILPLLPEGMILLSEFEQEKAAAAAASSLAAIMRFSAARSTDVACLSLLKMALLILGRRGLTVTLQVLIDAVSAPDNELQQAASTLKPQNFPKLAEHLTVLQINKGRLIEGPGELADAAEVFGAKESRPRLSIITTKFLTDAADLEFWMAQWLLEVSRWRSGSPSEALRAVMLLDDAELYLPATSKPAMKETLEHLLKTSQPGGLGILLISQSPADLDYRCGEHVRLWCLGRIGEEAAVRTLRAKLPPLNPEWAQRVPTQDQGQFVALRDGGSEAFRAAPAALPPRQLPEAAILQLARASR